MQQRQFPTQELSSPEKQRGAGMGEQSTYEVHAAKFLHAQKAYDSNLKSRPLSPCPVLQGAPRPAHMVCYNDSAKHLLGLHFRSNSEEFSWRIYCSSETLHSKEHGDKYLCENQLLGFI